METRRRRGEDFVKAILNRPFELLPKLEHSDDSQGGEKEEEGASGVMRVWRDIPDPYTGVPVNIVLRSVVEPFWKSCIKRLDYVDQLWRYRVCAVGTPGIGKTRTTPLLLRMLLLQRSTVVYIRRSDDHTSWFYEFVPTPKGKPLAVTVNVYPESTDLDDIDSLDETSTYYVVDPGNTLENCNPGEALPARVIIVSSPNEKHWRGNYFIKRNSGQAGLFHFYPLWNLTELLRGLDYFFPKSRLTPEQLVERYRQVGGVPRHLFEEEDEYKRILFAQKQAVEKVSSDQAKKILHGDMDTMGLFSDGSPKSAVIGIALAINDGRTFTDEKAVAISTTVAEGVFSSHINAIWNDMVDNERSLVFETYLRTFLTKGRKIMVQPTEQGRRPSVPASGEPAPDEPAPEQPPIIIGGYRGIQIVLKGKSIVKAAMDNPEATILFYSSNKQYPLIDFACRDEKGNILTFQATTSLEHTTNEKEIENVENEVGDIGDKVLMLLNLYPDRSGRFKTKPVMPSTSFCRIYHVPIPMPTQDAPSQPETGVLSAVVAEDPMNE